MPALCILALFAAAGARETKEAEARRQWELERNELRKQLEDPIFCLLEVKRRLCTKVALSLAEDSCSTGAERFQDLFPPGGIEQNDDGNVRVSVVELAECCESTLWVFTLDATDDDYIRAVTGGEFQECAWGDRKIHHAQAPIVPQRFCQHCSIHTTAPT